jgi:hypothetical protein
LSRSRLPLAFVLAVFTSASLLFLVQPMVAKMLLPLFGGAATVWNTCLVFYQAALLLGYLHAHLISRRLSLRAQVIVHSVLLALAVLALPIRLASPGSGEANPIPALLWQLTLAVGLPFFALSATGTLLQSWFARSTHPAARDPYFLYAASNTGSLLALLAYPALIEPRMGLGEQGRLWSWGFGALLVLVAGCGALVLRHVADAPFADVTEDAAPTARTRLAWTLLALMPSSLMMAVTLHLTTDIAPVPLLWTIPLCLYLLAFILAFARIPSTVVAGAGFVAGPVLLLLLFFELSEMHYPTSSALLLHLTTFFLLSFVFLGKLAALRPRPRHLTGFYLWIALGGVLGGILNAIVAPLVFRTPIEYLLLLLVAAAALPFVRLPQRPPPPRPPLSVDLVAAAFTAVLTAWLLTSPAPLRAIDLTPIGDLVGFPRWRVTTLLTYAIPIVWCFALYLRRRTLAFALSLCAVAAICTHDNQGLRTVLLRERSFFSVLTVADDPEGDCRHLLSGRTPHGRQFIAPEEHEWPLAFYTRKGPVGDIFREMSGARQPSDVAVVGLGTGSIAAYGEPGEHITFYEIDPAVVRIARDPSLFTYLHDSKAAVDVVTGDARLRLADAPPHRFGLIMIDAFSSDAIPVHLLTREALAMYLDKLRSDGLLALHISNRYLDLLGLTGRLAQDAGLAIRVKSWNGRDGCASLYTRWVVLARDERSLGALAGGNDWEPVAIPAGTPLWSDEFSNLLSVLDLR